MPVAFVIRPFNVKKDSAGTELDFDRVYDILIKPALEECGFPGGDMGEIVAPGNIREDMFANTRTGDAPGGTAHMVALGRARVDVSIERIDATTLGQAAVT